MTDLRRRLAKLESVHPAGGAHSPTAEEAAYAQAELGRIMGAIATEKAAGDVHGVAARQIAELTAVFEQIAAERRA